MGDYSLVLMATDLTPRSDRVMSVAADLTEALKARLLAVHVLPESELEDRRQSMPDDSAFLDVIRDQLQGDITDQLRRTIGDRQIPSRAEVVLGEPGVEISRMAQSSGAGLIVLGLRHRSRVGKFIMGSVTQDVLLSARCPVVAVRA